MNAFAVTVAAAAVPRRTPAPSQQAGEACRRVVAGTVLSPPASPLARSAPSAVPVVRSSNCQPVLPQQLAELDMDEFWFMQVAREVTYAPSPSYLLRHPQIKPKMRSLLLDWLVEVCEEFLLHRETYYLAVNFIDRFFTLSRDFEKAGIQTLGITCLFMAAKLQEIYPPHISKFAELTDGACTERNIVTFELRVVKQLGWQLAPVTPVAWLELFLQTRARPTTTLNFVSNAQYDKRLFTEAARLVDLCSLDIQSLRFKPSVLAAAAILQLEHCDTLPFTGMHRTQENK